MSKNISVMCWTGLKTKRTLKETNLRACLHEGGGPQLGEVTCLGMDH